MTEALQRFPALVSLLIQAAVLILILSAAPAPVSENLWLFALTQGAAAGLLSRACRQEPWWMAIHGAFPISVVAVGYLALPDWVFLSGFVVFALLFWTTFRTRVPFYPSGPKVWQAVLEDLPDSRLSILDVGSGMGGFILYAARSRPNWYCWGVEVAPLPWLVSRLRAALEGNACRFCRMSYEAVDFRELDVVFAYLSPAAMPGLWKKASAEMRDGTRLYSFEFPVVDMPAAAQMNIAGTKAALYRYDMGTTGQNCGANPSDCKIRHAI